MAQNPKPNDRRPATKFNNLRKKMDQAKVRSNVKNIKRTTHK